MLIPAAIHSGPIRGPDKEKSSLGRRRTSAVVCDWVDVVVAD
jgi:hypothetical protein